jgi:hypothetical protein
MLLSQALPGLAETVSASPTTSTRMSMHPVFRSWLANDGRSLYCGGVTGRNAVTHNDVDSTTKYRGRPLYGLLDGGVVGPHFGSVMQIPLEGQ